jgi:hypothetical protein
LYAVQHWIADAVVKSLYVRSSGRKIDRRVAELDLLLDEFRNAVTSNRWKRFVLVEAAVGAQHSSRGVLPTDEEICLIRPVKDNVRT